jgi:hypothetical protein
MDLETNIIGVTCSDDPTQHFPQGRNQCRTRRKKPVNRSDDFL